MPRTKQEAPKERQNAGATVNIGALITQAPEIRGGRLCIAGTGVTVQRIVGWYKLGLSPEEIAEEFGHLTLAQVYAALAYYHVNPEEIEAAIAADEAEATRLLEAQGKEHSAPSARGWAYWRALGRDARPGRLPDAAAGHDPYLYSSDREDEHGPGQERGAIGEELVLRIPGEVLAALKLPPSEVKRELRRELAVALYHRWALSFGKARLLAQMSKWEFGELLGQRGIPRHYTEADLAEDIRYSHSAERAKDAKG